GQRNTRWPHVELVSFRRDYFWILRRPRIPMPTSPAPKSQTVIGSGMTKVSSNEVKCEVLGSTIEISLNIQACTGPLASLVPLGPKLQTDVDAVPVAGPVPMQSPDVQPAA